MADLPSHLHLVYHALQPYPADIPLEDVYANLDLPAGVGSRPVVYPNMVPTFDWRPRLGGGASPTGTDRRPHPFPPPRVHTDRALYRPRPPRPDARIGT